MNCRWPRSKRLSTVDRENCVRFLHMDDKRKKALSTMNVSDFAVLN